MFYNLSIKKLLTLHSGIMILSFLVLIIIFGVFYWEINIHHSHTILIDKKDEAITAINNSLEHSKHSIEFLKGSTSVFEYELPLDEKLEIYEQLASKSISHDKDLYNCYFAYEPRLSQQYFGKNAFIITTHKNIENDDSKNPVFVIESWEDDIYQKDEQEIWYHTAKKSKNIEYSPIYFDKTYMKTWMITAALGIYNEETFEGMVGIDILLDDLFHKIESIELGKTGGICLFRNTDNIILTKLEGNKSSFISSNERMKYTIDSFLKKNNLKDVPTTENKISNLTGVDGKTYIVSVAKINNLPWQIIVFQSRNELYEPILSSTLFIIGISCIFLIIIHYFIRTSTLSITSPLKRILEQGIRKIEAGNYDITLGINRENEFGQIASAFENMAKTLNETTVSRDILIKEMEQRKEAENESRQIQQQLEFILGATNTGLDIIDSDFNIRYIDPQWKKVYGDPTGRKCYEYFMGRSEICPGCGIIKALETKEISITEETLVKEGNRPVQVTTIPYQDENGEWLVAEVNADISERKKAEVDQLRMVSIIENSIDFIGVADPQGNGLYLNPAGMKMTGYTKEDLDKGYSITDFQDFTPEMKEQLDRTGAWSGEAMMRHKSGQKAIYVSQIITKIYNDNGEFTSYTTIARDISKWKENERRIEELHKELQHSSLMAGMAEVASGVLHNVGNVLNSVNISTSYIIDKVSQSEASNLCKVVDLMNSHKSEIGKFMDEDPKGKHVLEYLTMLSECLTEERDSLKKESVHLLNNIEHIKEIVRMQQDYAHTSFLIEEISVKDLVEDAIRLNEEALRRHQVPLEREYEDVPKITVQKHKVLQILTNLIRNAKYAMDETSSSNRKLTIRIKSAENQKINIEIADTGIGIPAENLTKIFSHGFTTRKDGHGFGLHVSAVSAQEVGGVLSVFSEGKGKGATFILELPVLQKENKHE